MESPVSSKTDRVEVLDRDINQLRQQLSTLKTYLMNEPSAEMLNDFDSKVEEILAEAFGRTSTLL